MPRTIQELFVHPANSSSPEARDARRQFLCPILGDRCSKNNDDGAEKLDSVLGGPMGVCSVYNPRPDGVSRITCLCPVRLYGLGYPTLRSLAQDLLQTTAAVYLYGEWIDGNRPDGVVLLGKGCSGEIKTEAGSLDWIAALYKSGAVVAYAVIEAQAIDTTGNYRATRAALMREQAVIPPSAHGLNWENVNKRIIPQLLRKGMLLKKLSETEPAVGIGFLVDANVYAKFEARISSPMEDDQGFDLLVHAYSLAATLPYESPTLTLTKSVHASVDQLAEKFLALPDNPKSILGQIAAALGTRI